MCLFMCEHTFGKNASQLIGDHRKFREAVFEIVKKNYPAEKISLPDDPEIIIVKGIQVGLQNLRSKFELSNRSQLVLEELVKEHLDFILRDTQKEKTLNFEEAKKRILLQFMPQNYSQIIPLISFPFKDGLLVGLVLDSDRGYRYLTIEDANRWDKKPNTLRNIAIENLNATSKDIKVNDIKNNEVHMVAVQVSDGFDAARILVPKFRQFLGNKLGFPFYIAIPNRDFLICWSEDSNQEFQKSVRNNVHKDFEEQPYPLSPNIFKVTKANEIVE
jgi:uncharacterized protein YtpQ (UPF0354 family)